MSFATCGDGGSNQHSRLSHKSGRHSFDGRRFGTVARASKSSKPSASASSHWRSRDPSVGSRLSASSKPNSSSWRVMEARNRLLASTSSAQAPPRDQPCRTAPCATLKQGWYRRDTSGEICRPGRLPVVWRGRSRSSTPGMASRSAAWAAAHNSPVPIAAELVVALPGGLGFSSLMVSGLSDSAEHVKFNPVGQPWPSTSTSAGIDTKVSYGLMSGGGAGIGHG